MSSTTSLSNPFQPSPGLLEALPEEFPFYHLGSVTTNHDPDVLTESTLKDEMADSRAIGFQLLGDLKGWLVILVNQGLDTDVYLEMGNILASHFATRLSTQLKGEVLISPPLQISIPTLEKQIQANPPSATRLYWHALEGNFFPIRTLVFEEGSRP